MDIGIRARAIRPLSRPLREVVEDTIKGLSLSNQHFLGPGEITFPYGLSQVG
jgi:hypothetical protein